VRVSREVHRWLALILGVQFLLWAVSGFYMVVVSIDTIHGDMLVENMSPPIGSEVLHGGSMGEILARHPSARKINLKTIMGLPVFVIYQDEAVAVFDAESGAGLSPITKQLAAKIASYHYAGTAAIAHIELIEGDPPGEIKYSPLPAWRIDFDDVWGSSFYVDAQSGRFITRRHTLWRIFDFLWMLHIMDYDERENVNNILLQVFSLASIALSLSGFWYLYYRLKPTKARRRSR
jgi:uncharacterized iron-regulated membrane protein